MLAPLTSLISGLIDFLRARRRIRIIKLDGLMERIVWTFRSWREGYPVPNDPSLWKSDNIENDQDIYFDELFAAVRAWTFLGPFFATRGYTLYHADPKSLLNLLPPDFPKAHDSPTYPYARRGYREDSEIPFCFYTVCCWPARDSEGREVVIRLASGPSSSDELEVLRRLNTKVARADPRNHTIHALDFISFDGLVFVVMPRWPAQAFGHDFGTVAELIHFTDIVLESFVFLHENRIAHMDFLGANIGINVMVGEYSSTWRGMRNKATVRYALYDFGMSMIFPYDMALDSPDARVPDPQSLNFSLRQIPHPSGPDVNAFEVDMLYVRGIMQRWVRHIENIVPNIGPFFDSLITEDNHARLTACQVLEEFRNISSQLTNTQMESEVTGQFWKDGVVETKLRHLPFYAKIEDNIVVLLMLGEEASTLEKLSC